MISEKENVRISKFLSLVLRHQPSVIGLSLDENGWVEVSVLVSQMSKKGFLITPAILDFVVANNNKKRFSFNENKTKIRASQGHSLTVDLGYQPEKPPLVLFHGTARGSLSSILQSGLNKQTRHHVHLSMDIDTAINVGQRYGEPVVLVVAAKEMHDDGFLFFLSENNVWLTDHVPVKYLKVKTD